MDNDATKDDQPAEQKKSRILRLLRPMIAIPLIVVVWILLTPVLYRQSRLSQVPDIGDPFPVSEIFKPIPEEDNAYPLFEKAITLWKIRASGSHDEYREEIRNGWDPTDVHLNNFLNINRPALEKWREATEKNDCQIVPIERIWKPIQSKAFPAGRIPQRSLSVGWEG